ncbi:hypothetical protein ABL78_1303 [Leptomonas seymouri]|uniref:Uncharacterized protein n=1 Tax=Leptomonas seymouri TaxID=5684 RepID=A0A0N1PD16_LEPSE|nr:hypothetical protein ABL78_1303 [Leptomonas seymouri]|eukprot:KPI89535.1 hypothetical protein ABL78_1303 [Leptomonas seymouri]
MLSNTKGYSSFSRSLGYHRDSLSVLGQVCPAWKKTGKCKAYSTEQQVRRTLAAAKDEELRKKATSLYDAQMDLVADLGSVEGDAELLGSVAAQVGFSMDPAKKEEMLGKLVAVLKQEPAYLNWSLDAAVAEKMVELRIKPCRYTHRGELTTSLKRSRSAQEKEEVQLMRQQQQEQQEALESTNNNSHAEEKQKDTGADAVAVASVCRQSARPASSTATMSRQAKRWEEERHRIFQSLTPLQRCVVCLLWQRHYCVEQGVICDVRLMLEKRLTELYDRTGIAVVEGAVVAKRRNTTVGREEDDGEDPLDAYLSSAKFEEVVERESKRVVTRVAFRPEFGMVDLSALPQLVAHLSSTPACGVFLARTLTYFTGKVLAQRSGVSKEGSVGYNTEKDDRPAPTNFHYLLFPSRKPISEKEVDLGGTARADELVEALEWALHIYHREGQLHAERRVDWGVPACSAGSHPVTPAPEPSVVHGTTTTSPPLRQQHVSALFRHRRIRLHGLTLTRCSIASADAVVGALHKRNLERFLYALDLSSNRLWSLRFLLALRANFAHRLLRLSLKGNPITLKPEYQEQVRRSLPQLTSLDGEPIRRPPLRLPKPLPSSCTRSTGEGVSGTTGGGEGVHARGPQREGDAVQASVLDCVGRLLYIWETRRIPHTLRELQAFGKAGSASWRPEEEWNDDNFPHRYLHPAATFSVVLAPELSFFDAETMRDARSVELDTDYNGMRLSAVDVRDARVFDVAMKNSSRNLLAGRPALQRFGKGAENCFLAYQLTLYPERMEVEHHVTDAVISMARVADVQVKAMAAAATRSKSCQKSTRKCASKGEVQQPSSSTAVRFGSSARGPAPDQYIVTLHGLMTWRLPSMKAGECMRACYTRVMVLTKKMLPVQNREWERLRSPPYVLMNDELFLFPAPATLSVTTAPSAIFRANTPTRLSRLVVEFGLEACGDGVALVRDVMERCTSPAAEYAALQALVSGVVGPHTNAGEGEERSTASTASMSVAGTLAGEDAVALQLVLAAAAQLTSTLEMYMCTAASPLSAPSSSAAARTYAIFSVLEGVNTEWDTLRHVVGGGDQKQQQQQFDKIRAWATGPHVVTRALLHEVTSITNSCYTRL